MNSAGQAILSHSHAALFLLGTLTGLLMLRMKVVWGWLATALSHQGEPSTKRISMFLAALGVVTSGVAIGWACGKWIHEKGDLGGGAVAALLVAMSALCAAAHIAYRKPDLGGLPGFKPDQEPKKDAPPPGAP